MNKDSFKKQLNLSGFLLLGLFLFIGCSPQVVQLKVDRELPEEVITEFQKGEIDDYRYQFFPDLVGDPKILKPDEKLEYHFQLNEIVHDMVGKYLDKKFGPPSPESANEVSIKISDVSTRELRENDYLYSYELTMTVSLSILKNGVTYNERFLFLQNIDPERINEGVREMVGKVITRIEKTMVQHRI